MACSWGIQYVVALLAEEKTADVIMVHFLQGSFQLILSTYEVWSLIRSQATDVAAQADKSAESVYEGTAIHRDGGFNVNGSWSQASEDNSISFQFLSSLFDVPGPETIDATVCEWRGWFHAVRWKVSHLGKVEFGTGFATDNTLWNQARSGATGTDDPITTCSEFIDSGSSALMCTMTMKVVQDDLRCRMTLGQNCRMLHVKGEATPTNATSHAQNTIISDERINLPQCGFWIHSPIGPQISYFFCKRWFLYHSDDGLLSLL